MYMKHLTAQLSCSRQVQNKTDDDIEEAEIMLDKERIETEKVYDDCSAILKEYEKENRQLSNDVDVLLKVYTDAAQNVINSCNSIIKPWKFINIRHVLMFVGIIFL